MPFIDDTERLAELMVLVLRAFAKIEAVLMVLVLRAGVLMPPLRVARPPTSKVLPNCVGSWTRRFPEPTVMPPLTIDIPPDTIRDPFVIVWPPFTVSVDALRVEGIPAGGGYVAPFTVVRLMFVVLMLMVLMKDALAPPLRVVSPLTDNVLVAVTGELNCATPPLT